MEADLNNEDSLITACDGAEYIVHTASPFPMASPKTEAEVIDPAVNGTLYVMRAAKANRTKRVVITSSVASIYKTQDVK